GWSATYWCGSRRRTGAPGARPSCSRVPTRGLCPAPATSTCSPTPTCTPPCADASARLPDGAPSPTRPLSANRAPFFVEASPDPARVAGVNDYSPTPSRQRDVQMNGGGAGYGLDDHIYQRLLKERDILLGSAGRDPKRTQRCGPAQTLSP